MNLIEEFIFLKSRLYSLRSSICASKLLDLFTLPVVSIFVGNLPFHGQSRVM